MEKECGKLHTWTCLWATAKCRTVFPFLSLQLIKYCKSTLPTSTSKASNCEYSAQRWSIGLVAASPLTANISLSARVLPIMAAICSGFLPSLSQTEHIPGSVCSRALTISTWSLADARCRADHLVESSSRASPGFLLSSSATNASWPSIEAICSGVSKRGVVVVLILLSRSTGSCSIRLIRDSALPSIVALYSVSSILENYLCIQNWNKWLVYIRWFSCGYCLFVEESTISILLWIKMIQVKVTNVISVSFHMIDLFLVDVRIYYVTNQSSTYHFLVVSETDLLISKY